MRIRLTLLLVALAAVVPACGGSSSSTTTSAGTTTAAATTTASAAALPRLDFGYDASAPLDVSYDKRVSRREDPVEVRSVSFVSQGRLVPGFLLEPKSKGKHPAVVLVHGAGGDRGELVSQASSLAGRGFVTLTITEPSTTSAPKPSNDPITYLGQARDVQVRDVVAVRRAVDVLQSLPTVDPERIGYLGWSAGGRTGTFISSSEPRVKALALLSTGAAPLAEFVAQAPANLRAEVRRVLGSIDPIRYIAAARPGTVLLEDGRKDEVVPRDALLGVAKAAPKGTTLRWYAAPHALNGSAYRDAFTWLDRKLDAAGG